MSAFLGEVSGRVRLDIRQAVAAYAKVRADNAKLVYALRGTGEAFVQSGRTMATAGGLILYAFGKAVQAAATFEKKMDFFQAVTDASDKQVGQLRNTILDLANTSIFTADDIANGVVELGKAGVGTDKILGGVGKAMVNLGAAADISLGESGQIISSTIAQFALSAGDAVHVTDLLAGAANASIADISDIGVSLKYVGGIANATGLKLDDVTTAISILAKNGIRGSTAGTSLRQMIVSLGGATEPARAALRELGILTLDNKKAFEDLTSLGVKPAGKGYNELFKAAQQYFQASDAGKIGTTENTKAVLKYLEANDLQKNAFFDARGNIKPLAQVYQILQKALKGTTGQEKAAYLRTIFNNRALAASAILTREGGKGFRDMYKEMSKTTAAKVAHQRLDNLSGDIKILKSNINTYLIKSGTPFQNHLRKWVQNLTKLVQAFGKLDPKLQTEITTMVAFTGVALVLMGVFNILVGTVFKFAVSMIRMGAAIKFVWQALQGLLWAFGIITGGAISATLLIIIGVVLLLGAAFIIAYKKITPFRNFVNKIAGWLNTKMVQPVIKAVKAVVKWFKKIASDPKAAWNSLKSSVKNAVDKVVDEFNKLKARIGKALSNAAGEAGKFVGKVIGFFRSLPGRALSVLSAFGSKLAAFFTFKNIGRILATTILGIIAFFLLLPIRIFTIMVKLGTLFFKGLGLLAPLAGRAIGFLLGFMVRMFWNMIKLVWNVASKLVPGIIKFFIKLPGRIGSVIAWAARTWFNGMKSMITFGITQGPKIIWALVKWFAKLPGRIGRVLIRAAKAFYTWLPNALTAARDFGSGILEGIMQWLRQLPSAIFTALLNAISAIGGMVKAAFDAAKGFGVSLWNGFKDGMGIHSPSHIERAMWQITGVLDTETKKMSKQVITAQKMAKKLAETQLITNTNVPGGGPLNSLLTTRRIQKQTALTTANSALVRGPATATKDKKTKAGDKVFAPTINNPRPERATTSTSKALKNKVFHQGWGGSK